ncbi:50S ribosomal protein L13 [Candidatus Electrothrix gigas]
MFEPFFITHWGACMKTYYTPVNEIDRKWCVVDADGKVLGRIATEIARRLRGKHKPTFCNFQDNGDFIVVINADRIHLTGTKWDDKKYYRHTGFMGGIKERTAKEIREDSPEDLIVMAVKGMLPKNKLGRAQLKKLKVYAGAEHPHAAQQPELLDI